MKKILIVEDEVVLREAYSIVLQNEGYDVQVAADGEEAIAALKNFTPNLILLDLLMPNMDGVEFLRSTLKVLTKKRTKIIAFSNLSDSSKLDLVMELGVDKHILKSSLGPKDLADAVKQTLSE